ncbi:hypothetical protein DFP72DRAFT_1068954 [Ephemerocybe angulata]|uniref:LysM domain-containing protein n=1 Tax=Ephemerocybe angulata TaxID=980116 RepID=A0A8H6HVS3_9AGAR|nr:hypothetical protein DFP72DRAFT_1068954 [Tulosesus angulatus]
MVSAALRLSVLVAAAVSVLAAPAAIPGCLKEYTVQAGDWCDKISQFEGIPTYQLAKVNEGIIDEGCTNIFPGQVICLAKEGLDCHLISQVDHNNTCEDIVAATGVTLEKLLQNNPNIDAECTNIYEGEVLCVEP